MGVSGEERPYGGADMLRIQTTSVRKVFGRSKPLPYGKRVICFAGERDLEEMIAIDG